LRNDTFTRLVAAVASEIQRDAVIDILYRSDMETPKVTLVLLDWNCRESFHIFHYLRQQNVPRDWFEVQWIEFYSRQPDEISTTLDAAKAAGETPPLDLWLVMNVPETSYYHKHLMYNAGIALARGEVVCIMDSDAMLKPSFVRSIVEAFERDKSIALHLDEVRNVDRRFHPFAFPSFEQVLGHGCINWSGDSTTGLLDQRTPLFTRNYGACMCAKRQDLIDVGGADEHLDYLGHVCGPYDLTFRLVNAGKREVWHQNEFLYHVWHPGTDGANNYIGPHDGRNNSLRALQYRMNGQVLPAVENPAIRTLRENGPGGPGDDELLRLLLEPDRMRALAVDQKSMDISLCRQAYYRSDFEEAVTRYQALPSPPEEAGFLAEMGRAFNITGQTRQARELLGKALRFEPSLRLAHSALGWLEANQNNHAQALQHFELALSVRDCLTDEFLLEALRGLAWSTFHIGHHAAAERAFREAEGHAAQDNHATLAEIQLGLGLALLKQGRIQESWGAFSQGMGHSINAQRNDLLSALRDNMALAEAQGTVIPDAPRQGRTTATVRAAWGLLRSRLALRK